MRKYKGAIIERVKHPKTKRTGVVRLDKTGMQVGAGRVPLQLVAPKKKQK